MSNTDADLVQRLSEGATAAELCAELADRADAFLRQSWHETVPPEVARGLHLIATGGYGRREMYPHADWDILVLHDGEDGDEASARARLEAAVPGAGTALEKWIVRLQDSGGRIATRVRSAAEHRRWIGVDVTIAAASLDARSIAQGEACKADGSDAREAIAEGYDGGVRGFCRLIFDGLQARHTQYGASSFYLEPQLKTGRGGLRDAHAVRWAALLRFDAWDLDALVRADALSSSEATDLAEPFEFISRTRLALHAMSRWRNDRLVFERQQDVARLMGFGHGDESTVVAAFMKEYFRHADRLANVAERLLHRWAVPTDANPEPLGEGVERRAGTLALDASATEPGDVRLPERVVVAIETHGGALHPATRSALRDLAETMPVDLARASAANRALLRALDTTDPRAYSVRILLDLGYFHRIVPEWAHIVGHTSHDVYHVYTTDRHLFETLVCVIRAEVDPAFEAPAFVRRALTQSVAHNAEARRVLRTAALLHDVAKGLDGDHSLIGAGMAMEVARRLGLTDAAREDVRWLVLEHLIMARTSQRRDLTSADTIARFCDVVGTPERLDLLTVLTWADMASVGPTFPSGWKVELLRSLYLSALHTLRQGPTEVVVPSQRPGALELLAAGQVDIETIERVVERLGRPRIDSLTDDELAATLRVLPPVMRGERPWVVELTVRPHDGRARLTVCTHDRAALLADVAAAVASQRMNILQARIATTSDGFAIDHFELDWLDPGRRAWHDSRRQRLLAAVESVVSGARDAEELLGRALRESGMAQPHRPPVPTRVRFVDERTGEDGLHLLEVKCRDRVGLLADLARALARLGLPIERSLIVAEGDRAIDTFYLRLPEAGGPSRAEIVDTMLLAVGATE